MFQLHDVALLQAYSFPSQWLLESTKSTEQKAGSSACAKQVWRGNLVFFLLHWKVPDLSGFSVGHHCLFRQAWGSVAMHD